MRMGLFALAILIASPAFAQAANGPLLIVGNKGEDSISFIDLDTGRELARRETGPAPHEVAISPDGGRTAVVAYGGQSIDIFDNATRERIAQVALPYGARPHGLVWHRDGRLIATAEGIDALLIVAADLKTVTRIATGQKGTHMVAVTRDGGRAYTANMRSGSVTEIDLAKARKVRDTATGAEPEGIALSPDDRELWVADRSSATVSVYRASDMTRIASLPTGGTPIRVAISPDGRLAAVSNYADGTVSLFDAASKKPTRTIKVSGQAAFNQVTLIFSPDGKRLYAAETGIDRVAEIDVATATVLGRLAGGKNGDGLAIRP